MAKLNNVPAHILPYKDRVCIFCEGDVTYGAYWSLGKGGICVGNCCKDRLIHMYKDIILEEDCDRISSFVYEIKKDIKKCCEKSIKISIHLEKDKAKVNYAQIKEWENELEDIVNDNIW